MVAQAADAAGGVVVQFLHNYHYAVVVRGGHRRCEVTLLFEHLKDALKEAKMDTYNSDCVEVLSLQNGTSLVIGSVMYKTSKKVRLAKVRRGVL